MGSDRLPRYRRAVTSDPAIARYLRIGHEDPLAADWTGSGVPDRTRRTERGIRKLGRLSTAWSVANAA